MGQGTRGKAVYYTPSPRLAVRPAAALLLATNDRRQTQKHANTHKHTHQRTAHTLNPAQVYEALDAVGVRPDTTITNAAISACDKGGRWEAAVGLFMRMGLSAGLPRDAITYSAVLSALSKGRQWALAIRVFNGMAEVSERRGIGRERGKEGVSPASGGRSVLIVSSRLHPLPHPAGGHAGGRRARRRDVLLAHHELGQGRAVAARRAGT